MMKNMKRIRHDGKGFTMVERLVVIAILGLLAAIIVPNITGVADGGYTKAARDELLTVQTAMDTMMAKNRLTSVTATQATNNMRDFPTGNALYPIYLPKPKTKGAYSCQTNGLVTQVSTGYE